MRYTTRVPARLKTIRTRIAGANLSFGDRAEKLLYAKVAASVRERWFRTGNSLRSLETELKTSRNGEHVSINVHSGTDYDVFGEFGTRSRGRRNPAPHRPKTYKYSNQAGGIRARMMFLIGLSQAKKEAMKLLREEVAAMKRSLS